MLPYHKKDPATKFMGKSEDKEMAHTMKETFRLVKKSHGYEINSIGDHHFCFTAHILVGKIMRKCRGNEVPSILVSLA